MPQLVVSSAIAALTLAAGFAAHTVAAAPSGRRTYSNEERPSYHHASGYAYPEGGGEGEGGYGVDEHFDASFYDRKAPNEKSSTYREEKVRDNARGSSGHNTAETQNALIHGTREEKIIILEDDLHRLRKHELAMALQRYANAQNALNGARSGSSWFPSKEERERIVLLENTAKKHQNALATVQKEERALELRLKPLYGIVSAQFWNEQRRAISSSIETVHKMAADQTWYSTLFSLGEVDSLQELLIQVIGKYVFASFVFYLIGILFFALWTAPWTVYEYSSSVVDILPGVVSYLLAVGLMLVPVLAVGAAIVGVVKFMEYKNRQAGNGGGAGRGRVPPPAAARTATDNAGASPHQQRQQQQAAFEAAQQARYAPQAPRGQAGGFGGPVGDID